MDLTPQITFVAKMTEKEFALVTRALAVIAGVEGPRITDEMRDAAAELNKHMLSQQQAVYRGKLSTIQDKIAKVGVE
jgi:hypothetical protein